MRWILSILIIFLALWAASFIVFLSGMYMPASDEAKKTDVLVVLTGGSARVERGFALLAEKSAPVLFISGVGEKVTQAEMLQAHADAATRAEIADHGSEIVLDYHASSTQTNASEAARFVHERGYRSVRLITGHYHMPRSLVEFHAALPGVTILREPVVPAPFARSPWWEEAASRKLIWQEFHKYLAASFRTLLRKDEA